MDTFAALEQRLLLEGEPKVDFVVAGGDQVTSDDLHPPLWGDYTGCSRTSRSKAELLNCYQQSLAALMKHSKESPPDEEGVRVGSGDAEEGPPYLISLGNHDVGELASADEILRSVIKGHDRHQHSCSCGDAAPYVSIATVYATPDEAQLAHRSSLRRYHNPAHEAGPVPLLEIITVDKLIQRKWYDNDPRFVEGYHSVTEEQVNALEKHFSDPTSRYRRNRGMIRILFVHVPLPRMLKLQKVYGQDGEPICCQPRLLNPVRRLESLLFEDDVGEEHWHSTHHRQSPSVDFIFSGHDHSNEYIGVDEESGVVLGYGYRSGRGNYPGPYPPAVRMIRVAVKEPENGTERDTGDGEGDRELLVSTWGRRLIRTLPKGDPPNSPPRSALNNTERLESLFKGVPTTEQFDWIQFRRSDAAGDWTNEALVGHPLKRRWKAVQSEYTEEGIGRGGPFGWRQKRFQRECCGVRDYRVQVAVGAVGLVVAMGWIVVCYFLRYRNGFLLFRKRKSDSFKIL
jgi:hypothetical protein